MPDDESGNGKQKISDMRYIYYFGFLIFPTNDLLNHISHCLF
jgi:hypothetical protein